jgi:hypothetical protein
MPFFSWPDSSSTATGPSASGSGLTGSGSGWGEVLDHEVPHDPHRRVLVPDSVIQQPLHLVRAAVTGVLSQGPPVLVQQILDHPVDILPGLLERFSAGEDLPDPAHQVTKSLPGQLAGPIIKAAAVSFSC